MWRGDIFYQFVVCTVTLLLAQNACNKVYINVGCFDSGNTILEKVVGICWYVLRSHEQFV